MGEHAILAPSDAHRWVNCVGAVAASKGKKDVGSVYADEGTRAHSLAAKWLLGDHLARPIPEDADSGMADYVKIYTDAVQREAEGKILLVEQKLEIGQWTNEPKGKGTGDAVIVDLSTCDITVGDLKYGQGVMVYAEQNEQLMLYGLGALTMVEALLLDKVRNIKLVIYQPRRDHIDEWTISREDLVAWGAKAREAGTRALALYNDPSKLTVDDFKPEPSTCRWCTIKADCPAVTKMVYDTVIDDFKDLTLKPANADPAPTKKMLELIAEWIKAVTEHVETRLNQGLATPGWKLVQGKPGNRAWKDEKEAEELAKKLRLKVDEMYNKKLKTAPQMEKVVNEKQWEKFKPLIGRSDPKPTLVGDDDPRPAIQMSGADDFKVVGNQLDDILS